MNVNASDVMKRLTLEVNITGVRVLRARLWLGMRLMRLAVWVMGCDLDMKVEK
jgi:hypothetical protein